jgi:hypothetical protein
LIVEGERSTKDALAEIQKSFNWFQQFQPGFQRPTLPGVFNPGQDTPDWKINL